MKPTHQESGTMDQKESASALAVVRVVTAKSISKSKRRQKSNKKGGKQLNAKEFRLSARAQSIQENLHKMPEDLRSRPDLHKYWFQRKELFQKYNAGIRLDAESWYSVTPEVIARHVASKCKTEDGIILDAFCGCGGNSIAFARHCSRVIAIDIDPVKIECCRHNAKIYGVEDKIDFIVGDFTKLAETLRADVVFLSPPWGGPRYTKAKVFDIETMIPQNGVKLFKLAQNISPDIAYYLPRNVDRNQVTMLAGKGNYVEIEQNRFQKKIKATTAYYGNLVKTILKE